MHFTREPIVETIISAKEGYKLSIKSSKSKGEEEYLVDAIEVVSYGGTFFFRNQEKPKPFFLPATDYEVVEVRETRLLLKTPNIEKTIKIAGGSKQDEAKAEKEEKKDEEPKREKKQRQKKTKKASEPKKAEKKPAVAKAEKKVDDKADGEEKPTPNPSVFSHLLQPPTSLISDSIQKYKDMDLITTEVSSEKKEEEAPKLIPADVNEEKPLKEEAPIKQTTPDEMVSESPKPGEKLEEEVRIDEEAALATSKQEGQKDS